MELFGFRIQRIKRADERERQLLTPFKTPTSPAPSNESLGATSLIGGGFLGQYYDVDGSYGTESELVQQYREIAAHPEVDAAIEEIVNEAITIQPGTENPMIQITTTGDVPQQIRAIIEDAFNHILSLLNFSVNGPDIFRAFYIDGRLYYFVIIDPARPTDGIIDLAYLDPRDIRRVIDQDTNEEYYVYSETNHNPRRSALGRQVYTSPVPDAIAGIKIPLDTIVCVTSGKTNPNGTMPVSYLHKAIRPFNQMRTMEDALIIYRLSRAPERRVFTVDLPSKMTFFEQEKFLNDLMTRFKNRVIYDSRTGEIRDDRKTLTVLEDFWLPRKDGKGADVQILQGSSASYSDISDMLYFQRKLMRALNVPWSRMDPTENSMFNTGRASEISRDEIRFAKFISQLRVRFNLLFLRLLEIHLKLQNLVSAEDWEFLVNRIDFIYAQDNYFAELKELEITSARINVLKEVEDYVGTYFSHQWVKDHVLFQSWSEQREIEAQILQEKQIGKIESDESDVFDSSDFSRPDEPYQEPSFPELNDINNSSPDDLLKINQPPETPDETQVPREKLENERI